MAWNTEGSSSTQPMNALIDRSRIYRWMTAIRRTRISQMMTIIQTRKMTRMRTSQMKGDTQTRGIIHMIRTAQTAGRVFNTRKTYRGRSLPFDSFRWLAKTGDRIYWVNGEAGCGKSTLMNVLCQQNETVHYLAEWSQGSANLHRPSSFAWRAGGYNQKSLGGLLRSIIYQLIKQSPSVFDHVKDILMPSTTSSDPSSDKTLSTALLTLAQKLDGMVCLFIDGLDELHGGTAAL